VPGNIVLVLFSAAQRDSTIRNRWGELSGAGRNHAGMFVDRLKHRSCEPSTENAKSGQVLVRTREDKTESIDYFNPS
jgi:hypothetical protein